MLYHHNQHHGPWDQGHGLWNLTLKFLVKVFFSTFLLWKQLRQIGGWTSVSLVTLTCGSWSEGQQDPYFMIQWFCLICWRLFDVWTSYFGIMSQYDLTCDPKINVGHCDLYFMVQWVCLISWRLFDVWTPYLWNYESVWHKNKCRSLWPIFHGPVILPYILKAIWCMNIILWNYESVWHDIWPQNKCRSLWPIFHGPVVLPYILKTIWYMNTIPSIMSHHDPIFDLKYL